jgi:outer membrane protein OmpA-like peptidoglycan-associated protein
MRLLRSLVPFCATAILVSSCSVDDLLGESSNPQNTSDGPSAERCGALLADPTGESDIASVTVLLADGSASGFTHADQQDSRQDWATILSEKLPQNGNDLVAMGLFGGAVDWKLQKITAGRSTDENRTRNDLADTQECLTADLSRAMSSPPQEPQTDVLRALAEAADYVRNRDEAKSIYIATDGLSNTGCADLRAAPIGDLTAIPGIVDACEPELTTLDESYTVHFLGIGNPASGWSDVKTPQRTWMRELWLALCTKTGATCPEPDSAAPASIPVAGITPADDVDVAMPEITTTPGNPTVMSVPASILFDVDKYSLASGRSQDALQQVVDFLNTVDYTRIVIAGHTDSTGTPEHNRTLSQRRADAVAEFLREQRFTSITTDGYGPTRPACEPEYNDGQPDLVNMACNRRVEILVYT